MPSSFSPAGSSVPNWWIPSEKVTKNVPPGCVVRPLCPSDYDRGYLECLSQLTVVGKVSQERFLERLAWMQSLPETYMPIVMVEGERVIASGTLVVERKFIHNCSALGHIEDIVVCSDKRGLGLGRLLIEQLKFLAKSHGCYKISLDCESKNEPFYEKAGFATKGLQMALYFKDDDPTTAEV